MNDNRLVRQCYMNVLSRYDYTYVWRNQGVGNESLFMFELTY